MAIRNIGICLSGYPVYEWTAWHNASSCRSFLQSGKIRSISIGWSIKNTPCPWDRGRKTRYHLSLPLSRNNGLRESTTPRCNGRTRSALLVVQADRSGMYFAGLTYLLSPTEGSLKARIRVLLPLFAYFLSCGILPEKVTIVKDFRWLASAFLRHFAGLFP